MKLPAFNFPASPPSHLDRAADTKSGGRSSNLSGRAMIISDLMMLALPRRRSRLGAGQTVGRARKNGTAECDMIRSDGRVPACSPIMSSMRAARPDALR
jgi:hypothetical protein